MRRRERCGSWSRTSRRSGGWISSPTVCWQTGAPIFDRHSEALKALQAAGFKVNPHHRLAHNLEQMMEFVNETEAERDKLPYEIDGVVVKVDRIGAAG